MILRIRCSGAKDEAPLFGGEVSKAYSKFFKLNQPIFDATLSAIKRDLAAMGAAQDGAGLTVLDIASGPGQPSVTISEAFPECRITCTDISPDMVEKAKAGRGGLALPAELPCPAAPRHVPHLSQLFRTRRPTSLRRSTPPSPLSTPPTSPPSPTRRSTW